MVRICFLGMLLMIGHFVAYGQYVNQFYDYGNRWGVFEEGFRNPGNLGLLEKRLGGKAGQMRLEKETFVNSASFFAGAGEWGGLEAGYINLDMGEVTLSRIRTDAAGDTLYDEINGKLVPQYESTGTADLSDRLYRISWGHGFRSKLAYGFSVKYITKANAVKGNGMALDLGGVFRITPGISLNGAVYDIGLMDFEWDNDIKESFHRKYNAGVLYELRKGITAGAGVFRDKSWHGSFVLAWKYKELTRFTLGYHKEPSLGLGFFMKNWVIEYGNLRNELYSNLHKLTVGYFM